MSDQLSTAYTGDEAAVVVEPYKAALREIVVFVDGRTGTSGILEFAGVLAQEHGAHLIGVFIQPEPAVTPVGDVRARHGHPGRDRVASSTTRGHRGEPPARFADIVRAQGNPIGVESPVVLEQ